MYEYKIESTCICYILTGGIYNVIININILLQNDERVTINIIEMSFTICID